MQDKLLLLIHRLPYPPNKGDKIASFHLLRFLARHYRVWLGTFVDDPADRRHIDKVASYCEDLCAVQIAPAWRKLISLRGLFTGHPLSLPYLNHPALHVWTRQVLRTQTPGRVVVFSGPMAQYVTGRLPPAAITLFDMVDVDSEKWRSYAQQRHGPMRWLYRREADRLLAFERQTAAVFDHTLFVSADEAALFRRLAPELRDRITYRTHGVDHVHFDPALRYPNPYPDGCPVLVFTGAMDYWPNVDAVVWFAENVLPRIRATIPQALFCIVGGRAAPAVRRLSRRPGVLLAGAVADVRPYLAHAHAAALTLRIARGIQNKVLEAMSMGLPVIATTGAMAGIQAFPGFQPAVSDDPLQLAAAAISLLQRPQAIDLAARACVTSLYDWDINLQRVGELLECRPDA